MGTFPRKVFQEGVMFQPGDIVECYTEYLWALNLPSDHILIIDEGDECVIKSRDPYLDSAYWLLTLEGVEFWVGRIHQHFTKAP